MKKNVGTVDMIVRFILAAVVVALISTSVVTGALAIILGIVAVILLVTGVVRLCPLWALLGINTKCHKAGDADGAGKTCA